ncbi:hypothetical protein BKA67DRAFT_386011 [Truncatella angustata]|uniref:Uncharacterized protein n=1 Tax=Truncatella angustata TaxID=152316 RepID=A0A9P8RNS4_9PEZI|nr:uncharacterized protein BKA67DRAFT_386011 [Truncatella angustata]KAH6647403.1 hypothetical protein BKA67DRAFT_386011 [Truncatella angustata]
MLFHWCDGSCSARALLHSISFQNSTLPHAYYHDVHARLTTVGLARSLILTYQPHCCIRSWLEAKMLANHLCTFAASELVLLCSISSSA